MTIIVAYALGIVIALASNLRTLRRSGLAGRALLVLGALAVAGVSMFVFGLVRVAMLP